jgi:hypothetical protein
VSTSLLFFPLSNGNRQLGHTSPNDVLSTAEDDDEEDMRRRTALKSGEKGENEEG